jgi:transposase
MEVIIPRCAGLDVHKRTVVACVRRLEPDGPIDQEVRTFGTMTAELLSLADWWAARGVTPVALESTGVSWKPVYNLLEAWLTILVVNAPHIKQVPGRKPDVNDCQWIAQWLQHGRLRASFVPPRPIRQLRDLTRQRTPLIRHRATMAHRLPKVREDAHIRWASVATDLLGVSGRALIRALSAGAQDPARLADWARRRLRAKTDLRVLAWTGPVTDHHRFPLRRLMKQFERLDGSIEPLDGRILEATTPFEVELTRLMTIPGLSRPAAEVIVAALGVDRTAFPTAGHLCSWAGMSPGHHQSAGKRYSGRTTKGSPWLRSVLVQATWSASHTRKTRLSATYHKLARRIGKKRAVVAVGRTILKLVYEFVEGTDGLSGALGSGPGRVNRAPGRCVGEMADDGIAVTRSGHVPEGRDRRSWSAPQVIEGRQEGAESSPGNQRFSEQLVESLYTRVQVGAAAGNPIPWTGGHHACRPHRHPRSEPRSRNSPGPIREAVDAVIDEFASARADTDDAHRFGDNEFKVRARAHRIAAKALARRLAGKNTEWPNRRVPLAVRPQGGLAVAQELRGVALRLC